jgi:4-hydroxy-tetrahydrodipicolinate synthase
MGDVIREIALPRKAAGGNFTVLSGDDSFTLPLAALGGDGVISVISNLLPAKVKALTCAALEGRFDQARDLHYELAPFTRAAFIETNPIPIKQALTWAGLPGGPARLPLGKLSAASGAVLKKAMLDLGISNLF